MRVGLVSERCVWLSLAESCRIPGWGCGLSGSSDLLQAECEALLVGRGLPAAPPQFLTILTFLGVKSEALGEKANVIWTEKPIKLLPASN